MSWLDGFVDTALTILHGIVPLPQRSKMSFGSGLTATDNPTTGATDISVDGTLPDAPGANALVLQSTGASSTAWRPVAPTLVPSGGNDTTQIAAGLTAAGHVALSVGSFQVNANATIGSAGQRIHIYPGGSLKPASGVTLTIDCDYDAAPNQQVFDRSAGGAVVFGTNCRTIPTPEHFGAKGDGSTDDHAALVAVVAALPTTGGTIDLPMGSNYRVHGPLGLGQLDLTGKQSLVFRGRGAPTGGALMPSIITYTGTASSFIIAPIVGLTLEGLQILYSHASFTGKLVNVDGSQNATLKHCFLGGLSQSGAAALLSVDSTDQVLLVGCEFGKGQVGILGQPIVANFANSLTMIGGGFQDGGSVVAHVKHPGQAWSFQGVTFGGLADGSANSIEGLIGISAGVTVTGCWFGDISNGGRHIYMSGVGWDISGNLISGDASTKGVEVGVANASSVTGNVFDTLQYGVHFLDNGTSAATTDVHSNYYSTVTTPVSGYPATGMIEDGNAAHSYRALTHRFATSNATRLDIDTAIRPWVDMTWDASAAGVSIGQDQAVSGPGNPWNVRGQRGQAGHPGSDFIIGPGDGGTPGTDAAGSFTIDLGALVADVGSFLYLKNGASIGSSGNFFAIHYAGSSGGALIQTLGSVIFNLLAGGDLYLRSATDVHIGSTGSGKVFVDTALGAALDMGSHKINNVTDPTSAQDAATKAYVDAQIAAELASGFAYAFQTTSEADLTSTSYADLPDCTVTFTTAAGHINISFDFCVTTLVNYAIFKIVFDGGNPGAKSFVTQAAAAATSTGGLTYQVAVSAGSHTVKIQYLVGAGGTLQITPSGNATYANLLVQEVS